MLGSRRVVAVIPARAGSKGVAGKNMRMVAGRPLTAWTIDAALGSAMVDAVVLSSDDDAVLALAAEMGVPALRRDPGLATDQARMSDVVLDVIERIEPPMSDEDVILLLQPTSPLRTAKHVDSALRALAASDARGVVAVCRAEHSPLLMNVLPDDLSMRDFLPSGIQGSNRQDLGDFFRINGAIYASELGYFRANRGFLGDFTIAFVMDNADSVDIDTEWDLRIADHELRSRMGDVVD